MRSRPTTQHRTCIKLAAAVKISTAANRKGAEPMAQPDPDPDPGPDPDPEQVTAGSSAADGVSFAQDVPTICDGKMAIPVQ